MMRPENEDGSVKLRLAGLGVIVAAMLLPLLAVAEDAPIPKPRRPDRMPDRTTQTQGEAHAATSASTPGESSSTAAGAAQAAITKADTTPREVTLQARITDGSADIPDGLTWRVFETKASANGDLILAGSSDDAQARFQLVPGNYVVHVAFGRAQTTDTIAVGGDAPNDKELVLDAGAIRLNAAVVGDVPIPINQLRFDIYLAGSGEDRPPVAQDLGPDEIVALNAGTYRIVSHFGDVNAIVRAELRVEPGQMTEATIYHKAAQVSFRLVSEAGGEAIADIDWLVKTPAGDSLFVYSGTFPATVLAEGDYIVVAKRGETAYQREFQVGAGPAQEIEVLTTVTDPPPAKS